MQITLQPRFNRASTALQTLEIKQNCGDSFFVVDPKISAFFKLKLGSKICFSLSAALHLRFSRFGHAVLILCYS